MQKPTLIGLGFLVVVGSAAMGIHSYKKLAADRALLADSLSQAQSNLASTTEAKNNLEQRLAEASSTIGSFTDQISQITGQVGTIQKIQNTDKELLAKYSKVYFLNENYIPSSLTPINQQFLFNPNKPLEIMTQVNPYLERMLLAARNAGLNLEVISAYRSFNEQSGLKASYKVTYGAGTANSFSADQGYSEHQLGTALDFTTPKIGDTFSGFSKTPEYTWLVNNAFAYGFILSYPQGNSYYVYEPWHWRFVGTALATRLHLENKYFYDLDQRDIDTYLSKLFD